MNQLTSTPDRVLWTGRIPYFRIPEALSSILSRDSKRSPIDLSRYVGGPNVQYVIDIMNLESESPLPLDQRNYLRILRLLLFVEEFERRKRIKSFSMTNQKINTNYEDNDTSQTCTFKIFVEGLEEERPWLRCHDRVLVSDPETGEAYRMVVTRVLDYEIIVDAEKRFHAVYRPSNLYSIEFIYNDYPEICCHYALKLIDSYNLAKCMFPISMSRATDARKTTADNLKKFALLSQYKWFNTDIKQNSQQMQAVHNIITKSSRGLPYILYGPPGTGKTATVVEAVCQAWQDIQSNDPSKRILVCTPSNASADVIATRLKTYLTAKPLHRIYSLSTDIDTIDKDLLDCSNCINDEMVMLSAHKLPSIIITTLCTCTRLLFLRLQPTNFAFIFIDEAGQANEVETMIPFTLSSNDNPDYIGGLHSQITLSGDPRQLGPVVLSRLAKPLLEISMLKRLMSSKPYKKNEHGAYNPNYITNSKDVCRGEYWKGLPNPRFPIKFDIVKGQEEKHHWSTSVYNTTELSSVVRHVKLLLDSKFGTSTLNSKDIGIITPFTAQKVKLKELLKENNIEDIEVGTVQLFQGKEKEVIILSTVRSKQFVDKGKFHIGFLSDEKLFNVALTRARCLLIVIGNPEVLKLDRSWNYFIGYCKKKAADKGISYKLSGNSRSV